MVRLARLPGFDRDPEGETPPLRRARRLRTRFYAFLSYSHKDKETADWLHNELERFRVPGALAGKLTANGVVPKRLSPVFRDQQDLAAGDDLAEEIQGALAASQFLVVLCSPTAAKSRWTNLEIESFKRTRPEGCVLAAVLSGEPFASDIPGREEEECFPPALRFKYDRRGHRTAKRAEPLAADFREGGDGKRLAFLKLVAGMLGVGLDELVQRETTRRNRRLGMLAAASLAGMAVTSTLAITAIQARDAARDQRREAEGLIGFMLGDLKDKLEPIGRLDALDGVGSRVLAYYQHQDKGSLTDDSLAQRSRALTLIGEIAQSRGDLDGALNRYQEALAGTAEALRRHPNDPQRLFDHAQNVFWVGYIARDRGQIAEAAARFRQYQRLAQTMVALAPDKKEYRLEEVYANTNLGTVLMDEHRYREAAETYQSSLPIAEALASGEPGNIDYQKQVTQNLAWLADAREYGGDQDGALANRDRELTLLGALEQIDPRDMDVQREEMTAHRALGRLLASRGDGRGGLREAEAAAGIADRLIHVEPDNAEWLQAISLAQFDLADLQLSMKDTAAAAATTRSGCDIVDRLLLRDKSVASWKALQRVSCLNLRSRLAIAGGNSSEALMLAQQGVAAARTSPNASDRALLGFTMMTAGGNALAASGQHDEARRWWTAALHSIPAGAELRPTEQAQLAAIKLRLGDSDGARQITSALRATGYRHPTYVAAIQSAGGRT